MALRGICVSVFTFGPGSSQRNLMKKRSVRASKQANATGSLRKRKLEPRSYISPVSTKRAVARRYGLLGDITASVLWVLPGAAQPLARERQPHAPPAGAGRGGGTYGHPVLAVGQAAGPWLWAGYGHVFLLPPWHAPDHGHHHTRRGDQQ